jgi:glycosyltransferase involved in cell wall biosynthesis
MKLLMICGEDIVVPLGGRGVYVKLISEQLANMTDVVVITQTAYGQDPGFYICSEKAMIKVEKKDWVFTPGSYRLFRMFYLNDYPVIEDKRIVSRGDGMKKVVVEGHGKVMFEELKGYHNTMLNFAENLKDMEFDIVHAHDTDLWFAAQTLSMYYGASVIVSAHLSTNISPGKQYDSPHWRLAINREAFAYLDADRIHTLSSSYAKEMIDMFPMLEGKITVIPNAVNEEYISSVPYDENLRKERLGNYKGIITLVGRLVPQKGIDFFLEAVKKFPDYKFILISVYSYTHDKGLDEICNMTNRIKKECPNLDWEPGYDQEMKWKLMKISDIGLVPSRYGSYEIVVAEWMSAKVPVIISDQCPIIDYLPENCCDIIKPSAESLIHAIESFIKDEGKIERAYKFAKENTWKKVATEHIKMYEDVLKKEDK